MSSVATLTTEIETATGSNVSTRTVLREFHEMGFLGRAAAHKPKITMCNVPSHVPSVSWSGVKLAAIVLWSSGNAFLGVMSHASQSGSLTDEFGFGGCQEKATGRMHSANCKVWWRRNNVLGQFFMVRAP